MPLADVGLAAGAKRVEGRRALSRRLEHRTASRSVEHHRGRRRCGAAAQSVHKPAGRALDSAAPSPWMGAHDSKRRCGRGAGSRSFAQRRVGTARAHRRPARRVCEAPLASAPCRSSCCALQPLTARPLPESAACSAATRALLALSAADLHISLELAHGSAESACAEGGVRREAGVARCVLQLQLPCDCRSCGRCRRRHRCWLLLCCAHVEGRTSSLRAAAPSLSRLRLLPRGWRVCDWSDRCPPSTTATCPARACHSCC